MSAKAKILYVEDDESLSFVTKDHLTLQGYDVQHVSDGKEALLLYKENDFDLCLFDVMVPKMDGFDLAQEIRKLSASIPILFITAKGLKEDRLKGFKVGGDDYIVKPYSIEELVMKIAVFLRRKEIGQGAHESLISIGSFSFDYVNMILTDASENKRQLTQKESELLHTFVVNKDKLLTRSDLLLKVWGEDDYFLGRSLDVFISKLRKYLSADESVKISTIHGVGFKLNF